MARTTIFPTQEILYDFLYMDMVPAASIIPAPFALEPGQTYAVQWGENLFENLSVIDAGSVIPGALAIGNGSGFELPGNNEPFAIAYFADDTGGEIVVFFLDGSESQTITVYQESAESPIVLKDRTGTGIEYEGVEGVRVFDKAGNAHVFVPPVETEEKTVDLDFSGGAMEVTPTAGKLLSKVDIPVPDGLIPENIAKDVDIAGVVGTHEGGGGDGGWSPAILQGIGSNTVRGYSSSSTRGTQINVVYVPLGSTVLSAYYGIIETSNKAAATSSNSTWLSQYPCTTSLQVNTNNISVSYSASTSRYQYYAASSILTVQYIVPGLYIKTNADGTQELYADSSCVDIAPNTSCMYVFPNQLLCRADLSESQITTVPKMMFHNTSASEVILPATVTSIAQYALYSANLQTIDMTRFTAVPTLTSGGIMEGTKILVPSSLHSSWIAASNWKNLASYIVPV